MADKKIFANTNKKEMWNKYCSFLDLSMDEYMKIQNDLMNKQIELWQSSKLGKSLLNGKKIKSIDDLRKTLPLTNYYDYAPYLLDKKEENLPCKPYYWIQTTWEGGLKPIKLAPYSREMLDTFRDNVVACLILSSSDKKGEYNAKNNDRILYGLAPLPYMTGLLPAMLQEASDIEFLPHVEDALNMSFSQRNKEGFKMALKDDVQIFFGLGSVAYAVSKMCLEPSSRSSKHAVLKKLLQARPYMKLRLVNAKFKNILTKKPIMPKDLFHLKSFMVAGTDNKYYKDDLEQLWGVRPLELFAGTEPSLIGTETWERNGMYFFPNAGFYEFVTLEDCIKNHLDPTYEPKTVLMNEVKQGETYELALSVLHGGAFMRYRVGDIYKCVGLESEKEGTHIPRFEYVDRDPWIIDVAGFTRFLEEEIEKVIKQSNLPITDWMATKDISEKNKPYLKLFVEIDNNMDEIAIKNVLSDVFRKFDEDYIGLEKILGTNPLRVYTLDKGTIEKHRKNSKYFMRVNAFDHELNRFYKK